MARTAEVWAARVARQGRAVTLVAVLLMAALGWAALIAVAAGGHDGAMGSAAASGPAGAAFAFLMWAAMVLAMMLPTAAPTFDRYARGAAGMAAGVFAGYTAVWLGIAVVATAAQLGLAAAGARLPMMEPVGRAFAASILIAAGVYQFTPLKRACLLRCRNPRPGRLDGAGFASALRLGIEEGIACLGCCWAMMAVMFAAGLMNLVAMALLGSLMGIEKLVSGLSFTYVLGTVLVTVGFGLVFAPYVLRLMA